MTATQPPAPFTLHPQAGSAVADANANGDGNGNGNSAVSACAVRDAHGQLLGSLKHIAGRWKFKAIGHSAAGELIPGGGPLTHRHNMVFDALDAEAVTAGLLGEGVGGG